MIHESIDMVVVEGTRGAGPQTAAGTSCASVPTRTSTTASTARCSVLLDIDLIRRQEAGLREAKQLAEAAVDTVPDPMVVLEADLRVRAVNTAFCRTFGVARTEALGRPLHEVDGQWNIPQLRTILENVGIEHPRVLPSETWRYVHDLTGGPSRMSMNAQRGPISAESGRPSVLLTIKPEPGQAGRS